MANSQILDENMEQVHVPGGSFGFSAVKPEMLESPEYTLVGVATDVSSSVSGFKNEMEDCIEEIVKACQSSPRAENLLFRHTTFGSALEEHHGFKMLQDISPNDYRNALNVGGSTALFDGAEDAIRAVGTYGENLIQQDFDVNGIVFFITDGDDNNSTSTIATIKNALADIVRKEQLESLLSILIGVNINDSYYTDFLNSFYTDAGLSQYIEIDNASSKTLAKLARFISQSVTSQSQALGQGGPSQTVTF